MKKALIYIIAVLAVIAVITVIHSINKSPQAPQPPDTNSASSVTFKGPVGEPVTFELAYRGVNGKDENLRPYSAYGFGISGDVDSEFIDEAKKQAENSIYVAYNPYLSDRQYTAIEFEDGNAQTVYFDVDGNGSLSDNERLEPADLPQIYSSYGTPFLTPDFTVTSRDGRTVPFRVMIWARFYDNSGQPNVIWGPMGFFEGAAEIGDKKMKFFLFPDFFQASYTTFGSSDCALVEADYNNSDYVPRQNLSSLIVHDNTFYRVAVKPDDDSRTVFVTLAEDKSPRGTIEFNVQGQDGFKCNINSAILRGSRDNTINFTISSGMTELPEGDYVISSGSLTYGPENRYSTTFSGLPVFAIKAGETSTVELTKPQVKIRAVDLNERYNSEPEYKTDFSENIPIYLDVYFAGKNGETYRGFRGRVQRENYTTSEYMKAHLTIADAGGTTVVDEELEPG